MTNGPDDQQGQDQPPPPPPPPPIGGGRGLFARNDPDQPGPPLEGGQPPRRREDPGVRQPQQQPPQQPQQGSDDNPFLLPNERDRMPVYGAPPPPIVPLALMVLAIAVGAALFVMSRDSEGSSGGITPQQAASGLVLRMDGLDITEDTFRREIAKGIANGRIPCNTLAGQPADNIAAGLRQGVLRMEVPATSGVATKSGQKADDASLLVAAQIVLESCPKGAAPAQQNPPAQPPPAGTQAPAPGGVQPAGTQAPPAGTPRPTGTQAPAAGPAGTPRPATTVAAPAATPRP